MLRKKVILPLDVNPQFRSYQHDAYALGIMNTYKNFSKEWLINNFLLLKVRERQVFYAIPSVIALWNCFKTNIICTISYNILDAIKMHLNKQEYIYIVVNEKYIPERNAYKKFDYNHCLLIYGYDDETKSFLTIGYNKYNKYIPQWIQYSDIEKAYIKHQRALKVLLYREQLCLVFGIKINKKRNYRQINIHKVKKNLKKQLLSGNKKVGLNVYQYIDKHMFPDKKTNMLDLRLFRVLYEHKQIFCLLCNNIGNEELEYEAEQLYDYLKITFYFAIKYNLSEKNDILEIINKRLSIAKIKESNLLSKILIILNENDQSGLPT